MDITHLQDQLQARAFLHDDPQKAYLAGVRDAVAVITEELEVETPPEGHADSA